MRWATIEKIGSEKYWRVIQPLMPDRRIDNPHVFGLDLEWEPSGKLISVQLALSREGKIHSEVWEKNSVNKVMLVNLANDLLRKAGEQAKPKFRTFYFVTHFARADLGHIENVLREFKFRTMHKAVHAWGEIPEIAFEAGRARVGATRIRIIDLFSYWPSSLDSIGKSIRLGKIDLHGKLPSKVYGENRELFFRYAKRDAEIVLEAFLSLRDELWGRWKVEMLKRGSIQDCAQAAFRTRLKEALDPVEERTITRRTRRKKGWITRIQKRLVYGGDYRLRELAMRCFWGGRNEAYFRGLKRGKFKLCDVVSLYPAAMMLQPLSNKGTAWKRLADPSDIETHEGFARVKFEFPEGVSYPCLPVMHEWQSRLYFPLRGESWCTLSELRSAKLMGCEFEIIQARVFEPGEDEVNHPLKDFISDLFWEKKGCEEGSARFEMIKLMMNSIYGKLIQRNPDFDECAWLDYFTHELGYRPEKLPDLYRKHGMRKPFKREQGVGPLWNPVWAALITGRARAIMGQLVNRGALLCATDGILIEQADLRCQALKELESVGSGLATKAKGNQLWIGKDRCYALFNQGRLVECAGHGTQMSKSEFGRFISECIQEGRQVRESWVKRRVGSLKDQLAGRGKMGHEIEQEIRLTLGWDNKRRLVDDIENIFTEGTSTQPWDDVSSLEIDETKQKKTGEKEATMAERARKALELHREYGTPIAKACKMEGISRRHFYRIRQEWK